MKLKDFSYAFEPIKEEESKIRLETAFDFLFDKVVELRRARRLPQNLKNHKGGVYNGIRAAG